MPEADVVQYLKDNPTMDERAFRDWVKADSAPQLQIVLNERGADKLAALTKENLKKRVAIVLEGKIVTAPVVMQPITGGNISISIGSAEEVRVVAEKIKNAIGLPGSDKGLTRDRSGVSPAGS
jgi:preprotein translocase subunit SecD